MPRIGADLSDIGEGDMNQGGWSAWPSGEYEMMVVESDYKPTKKGDGHYLELKMVVLEGAYEGKEKFDVLVLEHPNPQTTKIARAKLKELALAVNHPSPDFVQDSEDLHNIPFVAYITKKKARDPQYADAQGFENRIASYKGVGNPGNPSPAEVRQQAAGREEPPPHTDADIPF